MGTMRISYGQDVKRSALVLLKVPCWFHTCSGLVSWFSIAPSARCVLLCSCTDVFLFAKAEAAVETRQVFLSRGKPPQRLALFGKGSCSQAKPPYKDVAGVNDPGYIPKRFNTNLADL
jgi:hypothetical protein